MTEDRLVEALRAALKENERLRAAQTASTNEPIAIVGMSVRLPGGVRTPEDLWELVLDGVDAIGPLPRDRGWDLESLYDADSPNGTPVREGGYLDGVAEFDADLFGISPREAEAMDPHQRLLLQASWEAFERAGLAPSAMRGTRTGVFVGLGHQDYGPAWDAVPAGLEGVLGNGRMGSIASGRIAYALGLEGPALTVDTACSSSLVALHLAVQSLRRGECDSALAGGAMVMSSVLALVELTRQHALADDARCRAFGEDGSGIGLSEGVGVVLVQRLSDAVAAGREVLAVVRGGAVNQDGRSNGLTAPSGAAQRRVIRSALADAGLTATDVDAVEAHGTGTALGDPIEADALMATYGQDRDEPLWLGSLKSNIGHTQFAAGIAGVVKAVLALRHGILPGTLHADPRSSRIDWSAGAVELLTERRPWPETGRPRRMAVSSFGLSGTNAHLVLEQAPVGAHPDPVPDRLLPFLLSGTDERAVRAQAARLRESLPDAPLADIALSLATTRSHLAARVAVVAGDREGLAAALGDVARGVTPVSTVDSHGGVVFVFPGQGSQWQGMGVELLEHSPVFRDRMADCARALAAFIGWDVRDVLLDVPGAPSAERIDVVQPVLFALNVSLAALWRSYGVEPSAVVGHSQGEIAAACVAGALSLADAARVVALRSRRLRALSGQGAMAAVSLPLAEVQALLRGTDLVVAALNGPTSIVVSGPTPSVDALLARCEAEGVQARKVRSDVATHCSLVEVLHADLLEDLRPLAPRPGDIPFHSTVEAAVVGGEELDADYWYDNMRRPVRFEEAVHGLLAEGHTVFVEVSAHPVLTVALQDVLEDRTGVAVGTLRRGDGGPARVLAALGELWAAGAAVDFAPALAGGRVTALPTYAFRPDRYWLDSGAVGQGRDAGFWAAVEAGDADALARLVAPGRPDLARALAPALPVLSRWRRRRTDHDQWRYGVTWRPWEPPAGAVAGSTVIVVPAEDRALGERLREVLGGEVVAVPVGGGVSLPEAARVVSTVVDPDRALAVIRAARSPLWFVTSGAVAARPDESPASADAAALWGLGRTAALEFPDRWGGLVDLPAEVDDGVRARLAAVLASGSDEDQVAVRSDATLVRRLVRAPAGEGSPWRAGGTVLVTGGTGAVGPHLVRWLARNGAEHVVCTSRTGVEPPSFAALRAESDVRLTVARCDIADRDALAELIDRIGPVRVVVHAAAEIRLDPLRTTTSEEFAQVLAPKVAGARNLDELLPDVEAFVLFSSVAGVWGSGDHGAYAAANAYLDALARQRRDRGRHALSVAWGLWDTPDRWGPDGPPEVVRLAERQGLPLMDPEQALVALGRALDNDDTCVAIVDVAWDRFLPVFSASRPRPLLAEVGDPVEATAADLPTRLAALSPDQREREVREIVHAAAAAVLRRDDVPLGRPFRDLGLDSLTSVELRNRLTAATGVKLPATVVFEHPTVLALTDRLVAELGGAQPVTPTAPSVTDDDPIAIVAMSCRLPGGVRSPEDLWRLLEAERDVIGPLPDDRGWDLDRLYDPEPGRLDTTCTKEGGFLRDPAAFDAAFFDVGPDEALAMDPQQRLVLETGWEAFERAGIDPSALRGSRTGVYLGTRYQGYGADAPATPELAPHLQTGDLISVLSGRVSHVLGLDGPAITVDTACSSSAVALHLAAQALRQGDCTLALAGGVTVMARPAELVGLNQLRVLSPGGRCRSFADDADGMGISEGVALVLLERLSDARRHGHPVLALVRGSALNQDGTANGLTAPNGGAQRRVVAQALANAGLRPDEVDAVEGHGTGTALGDAIEAQALVDVYGGDRARPLRLGSLKSNVGHTQSASGVAGVIKMVLAMRHGVLPRSLHAGVPSSRVEWSGVSLLDSAEPWPRTGRPRRAGVSSFGISGTNAHVLLEEVPPPAPPPFAAGPWPLSARSAESLAAQAERLAAFVAAEEHLGGIGAALASRTALEHRAVVVADDREGYLAGLTALATGRPHEAVLTAATATGTDTAHRWVRGEVDWPPSPTDGRTTVPTYAFQRQRYWL
ncbi:SDR family NAD(P)-dependent oxidoreductase [Actinosynnema sp. NPDC002837]